MAGKLTPDDRRPVIITMRRKDQRRDNKRDKLDIIRKHLRQDREFKHVHDAGMRHRSRENDLAWDVDLFEAPLVTAFVTPAEIRSLRVDPDVARVEEDNGYRIQVDSSLPAQVVRLPARQTIPTGVVSIGAPRVWRITRGRGVRAAVLDTGIDRAHPNLAPNCSGGVSFVPAEPSSDDFNGHGTHCAGVLAAAAVGHGLVGVAPEATVFAVKVCDRSGEGGWRHLISGIAWCIHQGVHVANLSLGDAHAPASVRAVCAAAARRGVLLIAGAGDDGPRPDSVNYPAAYPGVVAVAAVDNAHRVAAFSSRGRRIALAAPGVGILSCLPGHSAGRLSGTSMAAPHVSGVAVLLRAAFPFVTTLRLAEILWRSARRIGRDQHPNVTTGWGLVDAQDAIDALSEVAGHPAAVTTASEARRMRRAKNE